jgi:hypothetical protein
VVHRRWLARQALIWGLGALLLRVVVVPAERCPGVDAAAADRAIGNAAAWLVRNQAPDGRFLYGYHRDRNEVSPLYNDTRHAGVLYALYRVGRVAAGDAGMRYVTANLVRHADWTAFAHPDAEVGANALLVAGLVYRKLTEGDGRYDALARRLGRFLVAQTRPDGSVLEYWRPVSGRPVPGVFGIFSTGEAFYALTLLNRAFPDEGWEAPARRIVHYLALHRDATEGYSTRQADHWAAYGLAELPRLDDVEAAYARRLGGYFGYEIRFESQHTGRPLNIFTESGADLGVIGEGESAIWRIAGRDRRLADLRPALAERMRCVAGITVGRQVPAADPNPRAAGAWFFHDYTQMDDQQHAIGALLGAREVLGGPPATAGLGPPEAVR